MEFFKRVTLILNRKEELKEHGCVLVYKSLTPLRQERESIDDFPSHFFLYALPNPTSQPPALRPSPAYSMYLGRLATSFFYYT